MLPSPNVAKAVKKGVRYSRYGYMFALPFMIASLFFTLYPLLSTFVMSISDAHGISGMTQNIKLIGLQNYISVMKRPQFWTAMGNVIAEWGFSAVFQYPLQLLVVYFFTSRRLNIRGQGFFKFVFYMPNLIGLTTICALFQTLLAYPQGPVNTVLTNIGILQADYNFLNDMGFVRGLISYLDLWRYWAVGLLITLAAVKGIDPNLYEAADIDGANSIQTFFRITIPGVKKMLLYLYVSGICGGLQMYEFPFLLGGTRPQTMSMSVYIRNMAFSGEYRYGWASAASFLFFILLGSISLVMIRLMSNGDSNELAR